MKPKHRLELEIMCIAIAIDMRIVIINLFLVYWNWIIIFCLLFTQQLRCAKQINFFNCLPIQKWFAESDVTTQFVALVRPSSDRSKNRSKPIKWVYFALLLLFFRSSLLNFIVDWLNFLSRTRTQPRTLQHAATQNINNKKNLPISFNNNSRAFISISSCESNWFHALLFFLYIIETKIDQDIIC